jgi:hypothetical protein
MSAPLQLAAVFAVTSLAGVWMVMKGVTASMLERRTVRCRVCGGVPHRTCTCDRN